MIDSKVPCPLPASGHAKEQKSRELGALWREPCTNPGALKNANRGALTSHRQHLVSMRRMHERGPAHTMGLLSWRGTLRRGGIETQLGTACLNSILCLCLYMYSDVSIHVYVHTFMYVCLGLYLCACIGSSCGSLYVSMSICISMYICMYKPCWKHL